MNSGGKQCGVSDFSTISVSLNLSGELYIESSVDNVVHNFVTNMPGGVARTATMTLNNKMLPYALALAEDYKAALSNNEHLRNGFNIY